MGCAAAAFAMARRPIGVNDLTVLVRLKMPDEHPTARRVC